MRFPPLFLALLLGCTKENVRPSPPIQSDVLTEKVELYKGLLNAVQDSDGFIDTDHCDSLLFTGLLGSVPGVTVNIRQAREESGRWQRRPLTYEACFPDHSKTTISRDMLLGVLWYAFTHRDLELVENLWSYGQAHSWIMGDGQRDIVWMPDFQSTVAQLIYKLGGADHRERLVPLVWPPKQVGFRAHIIALHILLRNQIYGTIELTGKQFLKEQADRQPRNPLFQCANGNTASALEVLLDSRYWPTDRLPTSDDRCEGWLPQRDFGDDWVPCEGDRQHSGGDFLFNASLLTNGWCGQ
jgi:hypothetical protein